MLTDGKIKQVIVDSRGRLNMYAFADVVYIARAIETAVREECAALRENVRIIALDKLPGGNAYQEGWIDGTRTYQLTIEQQGEQK